MKKNIALGVILSGLIFLGTSYSQSREEKRLNSSDEAMQAIAGQIPDTILEKALGIAVIPNVVKAGAGIGGFMGQGVLSVRMNNGCWSYPSFISFRGASVGLQAGGQNADIVLVFTSKKSIEEFSDGKLVLGTGVSAEAGPVSAKASETKSADIYTYTRSRGAYVGASLKGASVDIDTNANENYYNTKDITFEKITQNQIPNAPKSTDVFKKSIVTIIGGC
jgi:lipid-binding SYLF domain-containing protein